MIPAEVSEARRKLGLSVREFAALLDTDAQSVRRWEMDGGKSTSRALPPRAARLIVAYLSGYRPDDWPLQ